jgi:hypothetical protein
MKKFLLSIIVLLPSLCFAYDVEIDGIYYNLNQKTYTAEVTYKDPSNHRNSYSGQITIPENIEYNGSTFTVSRIGEYAFYKCIYLTDISLPNTISSIGMCAFNGCNLKTINLPNSLISLDSQVFSGCKYLKSIVIPNSVTNLGSYLFEYCTSLSSVTLPKDITELPHNIFENCAVLKEITIPSEVEKISSGAFSQCSALTSIEIPNKVITVDAGAFSECHALKKITIGSSVKIIGSGAFSYCNSISDVYCLPKSVPSTKSDAFHDSYIEYATLHVPDSAIEDYRTRKPWSDFKVITSISSSEVQKCGMPTICYNNGEISFGCETEGVEYVSEITDTDIKKHFDSIIKLTVTYNISVYATKSGYENSDIVKATLCWVDAEPKSEGIENSIAHISARPIMIQYLEGTIRVTGAEKNQIVSVYTIDGTKIGTAVTENGLANIAVNSLQSNYVIVKIGDKSVTIMIN